MPFDFTPRPSALPSAGSRRQWRIVRANLWLALLFIFPLTAPGVVLWSDPGAMLIFDNGPGRDLLEGGVKRDDYANDTLYFKFHVDPQSDSTTEEYFAAFQLFEGDAERLGIGNALKAWAYSAFHEPTRATEAGPVPEYLDLHSSIVDQSASGTTLSYELP